MAIARNVIPRVLHRVWIALFAEAVGSTTRGGFARLTASGTGRLTAAASSGSGWCPQGGIKALAKEKQPGKERHGKEGWIEWLFRIDRNVHRLQKYRYIRRCICKLTDLFDLFGETTDL